MADNNPLKLNQIEGLIVRADQAQSLTLGEKLQAQENIGIEGTGFENEKVSCLPTITTLLKSIPCIDGEVIKITIIACAGINTNGDSINNTGYFLFKREGETVTLLLNNVIAQTSNILEDSVLQATIVGTNVELRFLNDTAFDYNVSIDYYTNSIIIPVGAFVFEPETLAVLAEYPNALTEGQELTLNTFIKGLKDEGIWAITDEVGVLNNSSVGNALIKLKNPLQSFTRVNNATFTPYIGFTGDGVNMRLDTGLIPSELTNYTLNDCSFYIYGDMTSVGSFCGCRSSGPTSNCYIINSGANIVYGINGVNGTAGSYAAVATGTKHWLTWRENNGTQNLNYESNSHASSVTAGAETTSEFRLLCRTSNVNNPEEYSTSTIGMFMIGANLNPHWANLKTLVDAFVTDFEI